MNQNEDYPGMQFLNAAFDSSTFIRTNYNYIQSLAALAGAGGGSGVVGGSALGIDASSVLGVGIGGGIPSTTLALSSASHSANSSMANLNSSITGMTNAMGGGGGGGGGAAATGKASSFILPGTSGAAAAMMAGGKNKKFYTLLNLFLIKNYLITSIRPLNLRIVTVTILLLNYIDPLKFNNA